MEVFDVIKAFHLPWVIIACPALLILLSHYLFKHGDCDGKGNDGTNRLKISSFGGFYKKKSQANLIFLMRNLFSSFAHNTRGKGTFFSHFSFRIPVTVK